MVSAAASAALLTGCGGSGASSAQLSLTPAGVAGKAVAKDSGCMSCHGGDGQGGVGPTWQGLAGSTRVLTDGTETVADRAYLERAISDPGAQKVEGYVVAMPTAGLTPEQVSSIVDYIEELS